MATLTLRPNGDGSELNLPNYYDAGDWHDSGAGTNYPRVDDVIPDEHTTAVGDVGGAPQPFKRDLYAIPDHTTESETINYVRVYIRVFDGDGAYDRFYKLCLRTNGTTIDSDEITGGRTGTWITYYQTWAVNPVTTNPWTWDEIDALEIGVGGEKKNVASPICTQVYVEIDYEALVGRSHGYIIG